MQDQIESRRENGTISVVRIGDFYKVEIMDYIGIDIYDDMMAELDAVDVENQISNSVLWNSWRQKVNKGTYFVLEEEDIINIFIGEEKTILDIRTKIGNHMKEVVLFIEKERMRMSRIFNDENGSSYDIRYYGSENVLIPALEMSKEEAVQEFRTIESRLGSLENCNTPVDDKDLIDVISLVKEKTRERQ